MHTNPAFRTATRDENLAFARQRGFGILMLNGADGPLASHIPFVLAEDGMFAELHLTRSNPIARAAHGPALLAVSGPDAYISPDWYGLEDQVPTWNYVSVHLRGTLSEMDIDLMKGHVDALSAVHENRLLPKQPWHSDKMSEGTLPRMMRMILPFRLTIGSVEGTWKLNQNKPDEARAKAADALSAQPDAGAQAIAALMRRKTD
ncbi:FMN-binding negative transcriptional regulator [Tabrizicola sp. BL-A-41-H6]|uniref:FMN-binding negative transcriptional regulator n=1 Tax=Tabrizicola sp. BL-A-41-H6 TaxID=3421107 RepID=UPI003D670332